MKILLVLLLAITSIDSHASSRNCLSLGEEKASAVIEKNQTLAPYFVEAYHTFEPVYMPLAMSPNGGGEDLHGISVTYHESKFYVCTNQRGDGFIKANSHGDYALRLLKFMQESERKKRESQGKGGGDNIIVFPISRPPTEKK